MPLLHKKKFELMELPENLEPDEKVFCCSITNEIFRDYESVCFIVLLQILM